ncbi:MAG: biotin-dependent carboxyltransferase [Arenimonas sp.]|nr:biotin-dependent carboxyltransferase [Arenimonas sp.]
MLTFESAGLCCLQDLGRPGLQHLGISESGAMDSFAARVANALLANDGHAPVLEITLAGTKLHIVEAQWFAVTGADLSAELNGSRIPLCQPFFVPENSVLHFKRCQTGCRAYLAVQGGFASNNMLSSAATDLRSGLGGFHGRWFQKNDQLAYQQPTQTKIENVHWHTRFAHPDFLRDEPLYFIAGNHWPQLSDKQQAHFQQQAWRVSAQSDRMGIRLAYALTGEHVTQSQLSSAVAFGSIQLPPDNCPIILTADRQSTGGYPLIGTVASVSHVHLAQCKPGDTLNFMTITLEHAQTLLAQRELEFKRWQQHLRSWWQHANASN